MRKIMIATAALAFVLGSSAAWAQVTPIAGTPHDFTGTGVIGTPPGGGTVSGATSVNLGITQYCLPCHTPHNGVNTSTLQRGPLWNHALSSEASFTQGTKTLTLGTTLSDNSALCMGCHDGVTAVSSFNIADSTQVITPSQLNQPIGAGLSGTPFYTSILGGTVYLGALAVTGDLTNTHPLNVYPNPPYSGFTAENAAKGTVGTANLPLETITNTNVSHGTVGTYMGCTTCHNPHDNTNGKFLRISNANSALCLQCHITLN